jgi:hypothetical protein
VVAIGLTAPALALTDRPLEQTRPSFNGNSATASAALHAFLAFALATGHDRGWSGTGYAHWRSTPASVAPANRVAIAMQRVCDEKVLIASKEQAMAADLTQFVPLARTVFANTRSLL